MRATRRFGAALISLLLAATPAAALDIVPALDGSSWESWTKLNPRILQFDERDWALFIRPDASEFLLPEIEAVGADLGTGGLEGLLTHVWERP